MNGNVSMQGEFSFDAYIGSGCPIDLNDAALRAKVSVATIRNWIKAGHLRSNDRGKVDLASLDSFLNVNSRDKKLTSRANKSRKDFHDHTSLISEFSARLATDNRFATTIASDYETSLSESYRNDEGVFYTPLDVVSDFFSASNCDFSEKTFCDPCCGSGNFIVRAFELGFRPENVFGYDVDPIAVLITKKRIFELTGYISENIRNLNFLDVATDDKVPAYDFIYTNPPWGKKMLKDAREEYAKLLYAGRSSDSCSLFFFACLKCLAPSGEMGLLLPESFFNVAAFESARLKLLSLDLRKVIDYKKPFKGLLTKAIAFDVKNRPAELGDGRTLCKCGDVIFERATHTFMSNPKSIINFSCNSESAEVISHVLKFPHLTLRGRAKWGIGIVTGNNEKFLHNKMSSGMLPVYRGLDIGKNEIANPSCFISDDLSLYQQVAPIDLFTAKGKLIYRFISSNLRFYWDDGQRFVLNSANMVIPDDDFPVSGIQLSNLLNCDFMNWFFKNLFSTNKILRADLESLPIHFEYFIENQEFNEEAFLNFLNLEKNKNGTYRVKR